MIDTISIRINVRSSKREYIEEKVMNILYSAIKNLSYQNKLYFLVENNSLTVILSYPRYFYFTNAYLISRNEECLEVNNNFITYLKECIILNTGRDYINYLIYFENNIEITLTRVDTPFTYFMETGENFYSYKNIYKILSSIYIYNNSKCNPKSYNELMNNKIETLIFTDTSNIGAFNSKITIYNQFNKMFAYYQNNSNMFKQIIKDYPDLQNRIRIEVSKKIRRKSFSPEEFRVFPVFEYVYKFVDYALENMFNINILEQIIFQQKEKLKILLLQEKILPNFNYESFIYRNLEEIWDYDILRQATMESLVNINSGYHACSRIKFILECIQQNKGIIFFGVIKKIYSMINYFNQIKRGY